MLRVEARRLLAFTPAQLKDILTGEFILEMDDGEIQTNALETLFSSYAWRFHTTYPKTPLLIRHHVKTTMNGARYTANTHSKLLMTVLEDTYQAYLPERILRDNLAKLFYEIFNQIYNDWILIGKRNVSSMDILHFVEILKDPDIVAHKAKQTPDNASIMEGYRICDKVLMDTTRFKNNPVAAAYRSKLVNVNQVHQSIMARGFVTDVDSNRFREPIMSGYVEGLRKFHDAFIETRSASKSLELQKRELSDTEYSSRKTQLVCMQVERLYPGDCGSQSYLDWFVSGPKYDELGNQIWAGDLRYMVGKYYLDETTKQLLPIRGNEKHLEGRYIKLRSVFSCAHPAINGVCETCFGELSLQVPRRTNLGHLCCVSFTGPASQSVISVKHLDSSADLEPIIIRGADQQYLKASKDKQSYLIHERFAKLERAELIIPAKDAPALNDVMKVSNIHDISISRISELDTIQLRHGTGKNIESYDLTVAMQQRKSSLTYEFLEHIRTRGWNVEQGKKNAYYVIDLTGWDFTQPVLTLPMRQFNMADYAKEIAVLLQATRAELVKRDKQTNDAQFLSEFFPKVNSRLSINFAVIEVIAYAFKLVSAEKGDYRLPKAWTESGMGVHSALMENRSLAPLFAYQGQYKALSSPASYVIKNRPDHIFDHILMGYPLLNGTGYFDLLEKRKQQSH